MPISAPSQVLDVRTLAGPNRCQSVLGAFDALAPGETLLVVSGHRPAKLLRHLQADRKGEFEWSPLQDDPELHRTAITRRAAARGALRQVEEALSWDHDRLEEIEGRAFAQHQRRDLVGARAAWAEFELGLRRHIAFEEQVLFPAFEAAAGMPSHSGPTMVMRTEHRAIERLLSAITGALAGAADPLPLREELHAVLGAHNMKEEQVLYPMTDRALSPEESDALVARIQAT